MQKSIIFLVGFELNNDTDLKKRKVTSHSSLKFYINNIEWNFSLTESAEIDKIILILKKLANFLLRFYLGCSLLHKNLYKWSNSCNVKLIIEKLSQ